MEWPLQSAEKKNGTINLEFNIHHHHQKSLKTQGTIKACYTYTKAEKMCPQLARGTRNIKQSSSGRREMIPDESLDLYKGGKTAGNGN